MPMVFILTAASRGDQEDEKRAWPPGQEGGFLCRVLRAGGVPRGRNTTGEALTDPCPGLCLVQGLSSWSRGLSG